MHHNSNKWCEGLRMGHLCASTPSNFMSGLVCPPLHPWNPTIISFKSQVVLKIGLHNGLQRARCYPSLGLQQRSTNKHPTWIKVSINQEFIYIIVCLSTSLSMRLYFPSLLFAVFFDVVPHSFEEVSPWWVVRCPGCITKWTTISRFNSIFNREVKHYKLNYVQIKI